LLVYLHPPERHSFPTRRSSDLESIHFHVIIWIILFEFRQQIKDLTSLLPLKFRTLLLNDRLIPSFLVDLITNMRFSLTLLLNEWKRQMVDLPLYTQTFLLHASSLHLSILLVNQIPVPSFLSLLPYRHQFQVSLLNNDPVIVLLLRQYSLLLLIDIHSVLIEYYPLCVLPE